MGSDREHFQIGDCVTWVRRNCNTEEWERRYGIIIDDSNFSGKKSIDVLLPPGNRGDRERCDIISHRPEKIAREEYDRQKALLEVCCG